MSDREMTKPELRRFAVGAYLPTAVSMIGYGAVLPLLPLTARDLGASVAEAAACVAIAGVGALIGVIPGGVLADKFGEKRAIVGACLFDAVCMIVAHFAPTLWILLLAGFGTGCASAVFGLARQGYITVAVSPAYRARALSTLGGVFRIGNFIGPLAGAAIVATWNLRAAYVLAAITSVLAALITLSLPDLPAEKRAVPTQDDPTTTWQIMRTYKHTYLTIGLGAAALQLVRASRDAILPLWASTAGLHPAQSSLIVGLSSGVDMLLFYVGGSLMDKLGRRWVTMPAMVIMGTCYALLPLTHTFGTILAVAIGLGLGNGISAGVVMTLGSDNAPAVGLPRFLAGWRLTTGLGSAAGPILISAITAASTLGIACLFVTAVGYLGGWCLWHWTSPRRTPSAPAPDA